MIEITTLGHSAIHREGAELSAISAHRQKFALLTYIALEGPLTRDRLVSVFWPEREEERARHSLSQALYALRRELGEDCLRGEGDSIAAPGNACRVDARQLEAAAAAEDWERVVELYGGPFLDGFYLPGTPEFDSWQSSLRTHLARLARRGFREVVNRRAAAGDLSNALGAAWRWASLEPLEDEAQHAHIALLAATGQRAAALKRFEGYRERLAAELGVEPLEDTRALVERIRSGELVGFEPLVSSDGRIAVGETRRPDAEPAGAATATPEAEPGEAAGAPGRREPELPEVQEPDSLFAQLRKRRVLHVGAVYLTATVAATEMAEILVEQAVLPGVVLRVVLALAIVGFPIALFAAWVQERTTPGTRAPRGERRGIWSRLAVRIHGARLLWSLGVLALLLVAGWFMLERAFRDARAVDPYHILVFPFEVSPEENDTIGEDIVALLGETLEASGQFRYTDGYYGLQELASAGLQSVGGLTARRKARSLGAGHYILGYVSLRPQTVEARAALHRVSDGTVVSRGRAEASTGPGWLSEISEALARQLLGPLVPESQRAVLTVQSDTPAAVAQFAVGDRAYRRARFTEALDRYRRAVELDSSYARAALKGAVAALWVQDHGEAGTLIDLALRRSAFLPPHRAQFGYGLRDYLAGRADSAVAHFERALTIAPEFWDAEARLGEVYYHLLPSRAPLDSLAEATFLDVHERDPDLHPVLYHLIQLAASAGDIQRAAAYLRAFQEAGPDSARLLTAELVVACVRDTPDLVDWPTAVRRDPNSVHEAGTVLAIGGRRTDCARAAWSALWTHDTDTTVAGVGRRFAALLGLQSLLVAEGRESEIAEFLTSDSTFRRQVPDIYILDALAGADLVPQAARAIEQIRRRERDDLWSLQIWLLGSWYAARGEPVSARSMADSMASVAGRTGDRWDRLFAASLAARAALASGDSADALDRLRALEPTKPIGVPWQPWESLPGEQLLLAELLFARGDYAGAIAAATSFDAPARPPSDLMHLPASLVLRLKAARRLGEAELEQECRGRLAELGRVDLLESLR